MIKPTLALLTLSLGLSACGRHYPELTIITTRGNGTMKFCGDFDDDDKYVKGISPEGSKLSINKTDVVTIETNGICK
ncbi:MAG: hypothetical protein Q8P18_03875 [Pseudomonadota bacterium]|nr:hypothetical protein [Pseudomonadota bacterium]